MSVRAKLVVDSIIDFGHGRKVVKFSACYDPKIAEDQRFQKATPTATAEFNIDNPAASEQFQPGKKYYVDFTSAE